MTLFWTCFAFAIVVLFGLDLLTAPKYGDSPAPRRNLKQSRRPA